MSSEGPFEWLAGGLFFGKAKGGIESIDSSKDALALLRGISDSLDEILLSAASAETTTAATEQKNQPESSSAPASNNNTEPTPSMFLAARLARLRFLLYDERRIPADGSGGGHFARSSISGSSNPNSSVAGIVVNALTKTTTTSSTTEQGNLTELVPNLLLHIEKLPFESRKDVAAIFNYLLVSGLEGADAEQYRAVMWQFRDYVADRFDRILTILVQGHDLTTSGSSGSSNHRPADVGLHYGSMYRACLRHAALYARLVGTTESARTYVFPFLDTYVHVPNFDRASDSMETLRLVLTAGSNSNASAGGAGSDAQQQQQQQQEAAAEQAEMAQQAAEFLTRDYVEIWDRRFNPKLLAEGSANYMTRRVALQILSTVLLTRSNYAVMIRFVASRSNLILVMKLLRDTSPHITLDAFHVFKVFVANPNKPADVVQILRDNKVKLCKYLTTLHQDREAADAQFRDEKALIIATIEAL